MFEKILRIFLDCPKYGQHAGILITREAILRFFVKFSVLVALHPPVYSGEIWRGYKRPVLPFHTLSHSSGTSLSSLHFIPPPLPSAVVVYVCCRYCSGSVMLRFFSFLVTSTKPYPTFVVSLS